MKLMPNKEWLILILIGLGLGGCAGTQTFTTAARSGETVMLPVGWQKTLARQNMTVTITPATGALVTYLPGDMRVRGVVNLFPDPGSSLVVDNMTNQSTSAGNLAAILNGVVTNDPTDPTGNRHDNEWWQTTVMMDLPTLSAGIATINIVDTQGAVIKPISVEILPGTSVSNNFSLYTPWGTPSKILSIYPEAIHAMERSPRSTVTFTGSTVPHSMQMTFAHTPGVGKTWVVNPRGDIKNVAWSDDGANITVVLTPAQGLTLSQWLDLKFYIAGGISGLTLTNLKAYDISGNLLAGITPAIQ